MSVIGGCNEPLSAAMVSCIANSRCSGLRDAHSHVHEHESELVAERQRLFRRAQVDRHRGPQHETIGVEALLAQVAAERAGHRGHEHVVDRAVERLADGLHVLRAAIGSAQATFFFPLNRPRSGVSGSSGSVRTLANSPIMPPACAAAVAALSGWKMRWMPPSSRRAPSASACSRMSPLGWVNRPIQLSDREHVGLRLARATYCGRARGCPASAGPESCSVIESSTRIIAMPSA